MHVKVYGVGRINYRPPYHLDHVSIHAVPFNQHSKQWLTFGLVCGLLVYVKRLQVQYL